MTASLENFIAQDIQRKAPADLSHLTHHIKKMATNPEGIVGIMLYGSGLWQGYSDDRVWDYQVVVDNISDFKEDIWPCIAGAVISPNVYYTDVTDKNGHIWRCKCNVMTLKQFNRHAKGRVLTPHIWARFAQPSRILYVRSDNDLKRIKTALTQCVKTFHDFAICYAPMNECSGESIWKAGLAQTYKMEIRSERKGRGTSIFASDPDNFLKRTECWLKDMGEDHFPSESALKQRRVIHTFKKPLIKLMALVRLLKSATTFEGGVDYALWKIERHSGVKVTPTEFQRKYPLIGGWPLLFKLWRQGALR